ncbi:hypothetical protein [Roseateles hydrophilus]|uniref:hypothetical protein n=1 Tax=Roseateles hydrophilus TaxID=2975054 RepID=UPI00227C7B54|nr:hypothetical protein [Pelomonas sp. UHG3]
MAASGLVIAPPAALVLGLALVGWAWWGPPAEPAAVPAQGVAAASVALHTKHGARWAADPPPGARPAAAPRPAVAAAPDLTALLTAPETALRTTLHQALAARAHGGRLYARALARRCAELAALQPADTADANDARHQRAVARQAALAAGCGQFANAEWLALVNVAPDDAAGDPLLAVQQSDLDGAPLLQAVMARPDALLLDELRERLLLHRLDGEPVLYFDGQRFDDEASRATAQAALHLLPCQFGLACDERDPAVWLACLRGEGCTASRAERAPPGAQALAQRLAAALRARDLHRFLPR